MKTFKRLLIIGLLVGLLGAGSTFWFFNRQRQSDARAELNNMLGQQDVPSASINPPPIGSMTVPEPMTVPGNVPGFPNLPQLGFEALSGLMPASPIDVQETPDAYQIKVPLAQPEDASSVQLNVSPHRIEISGQTGHSEKGSSVQSSFMQSFTTSAEVLPSQVRRSTQKQGDQLTLIIIIPKKHGGQSAQSRGTVAPPLPELQPLTPSQPPASSHEERLPENPMLEDDSNPRAI